MSRSSRTDTESDRANGRLSRRELLAGGAVALVGASAGCVQEAQSVLGRSGGSQISLSIATVVADDDPKATQITRRLREHLEAVGVSVGIDYYGTEEFRLAVLVNTDFDIAVMRHPGGDDPDFLYELFHSSFGPESGWQNPYGFSDFGIDELLESQRNEAGAQRRETVGQLLTQLSTQQPTTPICVPEQSRLVRPETITGASGRRFDRASDLLALESSEPELRVAIRRTAPTENLNPLSAEYRESDVVIGLLYDSLVIKDGEEYLPWLASDVSWDGSTATVTLRETAWHDGTPVTTSDIAFTYRLLQDTSLGTLESPAPAPRFRGRSTLVTEVESRDEQTVIFSLDGSPEVAPRALTLPILPEHKWRDRTGLADVAGLTGDRATTNAIVNENVPAVGSGPYEFENRSRRNELTLKRFDGHFTTTHEQLSEFTAPAPELSLVVLPSDEGAVEGVQNGDIDLTLSPLWRDAIPVEETNYTEHEVQTTEFYQIAYNTRNHPLSNPQFRQVVARLVDRSWLIEELFDGHARPLSTPVTDETWVPSALQLGVGESHPELPFLGDNGELDVEQVRQRLLERGYQYNEDGELLAVGDA